MKKSISCVLILLHVLLIFGQSFAGVGQSTIRVVKIIDNVISADKGGLDGIETDARFAIQRETDTGIIHIGSAQVVFVKDNLSALKLTRLQEGYTVKQGDILVPDQDFDESDLMLEQVLNKENRNTITEDINYYSDGRENARSDYNSGGAAVGGFLAGLGLGFIGWGIGYLIISNKGVDVPEEYTAELYEGNKQDFENGYTDQVKTSRKTSFNVGAIIGVIGAVALVASTQGSGD